LIALVGAGSGAVQRELARLEQSGLVTVRRLGTQKHFQANPDSPLFGELSSIARKTVGLAEPLRDALTPFATRIVAAFVFGSVAKRKDTAASDIDLMVVSDRLTYADVFEALEAVSSKLGRTINPTIYSRRKFVKRRRESNAFLTRVLAAQTVSERRMTPTDASRGWQGARPVWTPRSRGLKRSGLPASGRGQCVEFAGSRFDLAYNAARLCLAALRLTALGEQPASCWSLTTYTRTRPEVWRVLAQGHEVRIRRVRRPQCRRAT
jgi:predicted nucleotidyltransferase